MPIAWNTVWAMCSGATGLSVGILGPLVAGAEHLPAADAAAGQQHRHGTPSSGRGRRRPAPPERGSPIFGLRPISLVTSTSVVVQQAALVQVVEQRREGPVELRQQAVLQAVEVVAVRVPAAAALAQLVEFLVALPEDGDERHARLDQPPGQQHRHGVDARAVPLADRLRLGAQVERGLRLPRRQQRERLAAGACRSRGSAASRSARRWAASSARSSVAAVEQPLGRDVAAAGSAPGRRSRAAARACRPRTPGRTRCPAGRRTARAGCTPGRPPCAAA